MTSGRGIPPLPEWKLKGGDDPDWAPDIYEIEVKRFGFMNWESRIIKNGGDARWYNPVSMTRWNAIRAARKEIKKMIGEGPKWKYAGSVFVDKEKS